MKVGELWRKADSWFFIIFRGKKSCTRSQEIRGSYRAKFRWIVLHSQPIARNSKRNDKSSLYLAGNFFLSYSCSKAHEIFGTLMYHPALCSQEEVCIIERTGRWSGKVSNSGDRDCHVAKYFVRYRGIDLTLVLSKERDRTCERQQTKPISSAAITSVLARRPRMNSFGEQ